MPTGVEKSGSFVRVEGTGAHSGCGVALQGSSTILSVRKLTALPPPAYLGRRAKDAELGPLPLHPWRMLLPCKETCRLRYHSLLQIKAPLGASLVAQW